VTDPAARLAQGISARAQFRLSASEQQALDRAIAGRPEGDPRSGIGMDETAPATALQVLWRADADCAKAVARHGGTSAMQPRFG
jgi:hypothetical protein